MFYIYTVLFPFPVPLKIRNSLAPQCSTSSTVHVNFIPHIHLHTHTHIMETLTPPEATNGKSSHPYKSDAPNTQSSWLWESRSVDKVTSRRSVNLGWQDGS